MQISERGAVRDKNSWGTKNKTTLFSTKYLKLGEENDLQSRITDSRWYTIFALLTVITNFRIEIMLIPIVSTLFVLAQF